MSRFFLNAYVSLYFIIKPKRTNLLLYYRIYFEKKIHKTIDYY